MLVSSDCTLQQVLFCNLLNAIASDQEVLETTTEPIYPEFEIEDTHVDCYEHGGICVLRKICPKDKVIGEHLCWESTQQEAVCCDTSTLLYILMYYVYLQCILKVT